MNKFCYVGMSTEGMLDYEILSMINWRAGDIVISGPPKCGTNWVQQMVHQLRTGGDDTFESIRAEVPVFGHIKVNISQNEELRQFDAHKSPRALKTHFCPPILPINPEVRYLVVVRDVMEIPVSMMEFTNAFSDEAKKRTGMPVYEKLHELVEDYCYFEFYFNFLNSWFEHKNKPNVLFLHFNNMKKDLAGSLNRINDFMGIEIASTESFSGIVEYCSFKWMKKNQIKFELNWDRTPLVSPGKLIRDGQIGLNREKLPQNIKKKLHDMLQTHLPEKNLRCWVENGGTFPQ